MPSKIYQNWDDHLATLKTALADKPIVFFAPTLLGSLGPIGPLALKKGNRVLHLELTITFTTS
jgi:hypothetical protein